MIGAETGQWDAELCRIGGVDPGMQAELGWAGRRIAPILPEVAACAGLPEDTLVIAGGGDQPCACLGMGMTSPGRVALATGTAWVITGITESRRVADAPASMDLSFHAAPERWTVSQFLGGFGATVDWWLQQAWESPETGEARGAKALYPFLNAGIASSAPGANGLLFTPLSGPSQLPASPPGGTFSGLQLAHTRGDMARAILEGCGFEVRWAMDELLKSGLPATELWIAGGAAASPVWPQILADITGAPIVLADYANWAALGGAALAGWGAGVFPSLDEALVRLQPPVRRVQPNDELAKLYADRYGAYRRLASAVAGVNSEKGRTA